jgi:two-component system sensor histidine kinase ArlS
VKNYYTININDTGIGIAADELPYIFNRFKKIKQSLKQDSFGLGLPIVKSIAAFHAIELQVRSEQNVRQHLYPHYTCKTGKAIVLRQ